MRILVQLLYAILTTLILVSFSYFLGAVFSSCASKASGGYHAETFFGPSGEECYVILDGDNKAVGGNCL